MKISEAIKEAMKRKGLRQKDMAERAGIASNALRNQLSGQRNLSLDKVDALLIALGYKMLIVPNGVEPEEGWYEVTSNALDGVERVEATPEAEEDGARLDDLSTDAEMVKMFEAFKEWYKENKAAES